MATDISGSEALKRLAGDIAVPVREFELARREMTTKACSAGGGASMLRVQRDESDRARLADHFRHDRVCARVATSAFGSDRYDRLGRGKVRC